MSTTLRDAERLAKYETVIGLEVHAQLATRSKIFSWSSAAFGAEPNTSTDPVCLGMPGTLPVLNEAAVAAAVRLGLAVGSHIRPRCRFARKHYFYPDLPKGFQISQFDEPICEGGVIRFRVHDEQRRVRRRGRRAGEAIEERRDLPVFTDAHHNLLRILK